MSTVWRSSPLSEEELSGQPEFVLYECPVRRRRSACGVRCGARARPFPYACRGSRSAAEIVSLYLIKLRFYLKLSSGSSKIVASSRSRFFLSNTHVSRRTLAPPTATRRPYRQHRSSCDGQREGSSDGGIQIVV